MTGVEAPPRPVEPSDPPEPEREAPRPPTRAPQRKTSRSDVERVLVQGLVIFAVGVVAFTLFLVPFSALLHGRSQAGLTRRFRTELATQRAPIGGVIPDGVPVGLLQIPAIGVHEIVVQGTTSAETRLGPGHLPASVLPGQRGNAVVGGRRSAFGGPFRRLGSLDPGDRIRVTTGQGVSRYRVVSQRTRSASDATAMVPTATNRLTLVTSDPALLARRYRVVVAHLVTKPFASTGHESRIARQDLGLTGDTAVVSVLFVWLLFAALVGFGAVYAFRRLPTVCAWLIVAPLALAAAWLVFENLVVLLPATL